MKFTHQNTNMAIKTQHLNVKMYFLLNMGIFQCHVTSSFQGVVYGLFPWEMFWDARFIVGYVGEFPFHFRRFFRLVE